MFRMNYEMPGMFDMHSGGNSLFGSNIFGSIGSGMNGITATGVQTSSSLEDQVQNAENVRQQQQAQALYQNMSSLGVSDQDAMGLMFQAMSSGSPMLQMLAQQAMQRRQQVMTMITSIMRSMHEMTMRVIQNLRLS